MKVRFISFLFNVVDFHNIDTKLWLNVNATSLHKKLPAKKVERQLKEIDRWACVCARASVRAQVLQSCLTLCGPMDCSPPGSPVRGVLQATVLERVAMPSSSGSSLPRDQSCVSCVSCIAGGFFTLRHWGRPRWTITCIIFNSVGCLV